MAKLKVGVISYGSRGAAISDPFAGSEHGPAFCIASKHSNPLCIDVAKRTEGIHAVFDDLTSLLMFISRIASTT